MNAANSEANRVGIGQGRYLFRRKMGAGSPAVAFIPSLASGCGDWSNVQPSIARTNLTMSYDRAGYGGSSSGPLPRTIAAGVSDLKALLKQEVISPPIVLVGFSTSGLDALLFAFEHPNDVSGMVLVDPTILRMEEELGAVSKALTDKWAEDRAEMSDPFACSEWDNLEIGSAEMFAAPRSLGDMPLIVLTAGKLDVPDASEHDAIRRVWAEHHQRYADLSTRGVRRDIWLSGHAIATERPQDVIEAILEVAANSRFGQ